MSVFTVFSVGTKHTSSESNNTMARLYRKCSGRDKFINDGPGTGGGKVSNLLGNARGKSMDPRCEEAIDAILKARPTTVNLAGHSRGAVMCHMIANDLTESTDSAAQAISNINMILLDPVNMSVHVQRGGQLRKGMALRRYVSIVMENVTSMIFPSKTVKPKEDQFLNMMTYLHLPGTHGSGTQPLTSAIGHAAYRTIKWYLHKWGSQFAGGRPTSKAICDAYAGIHLENSVKYDKKGLVAAREISNDPKGQSTREDRSAVKWGWEKVGGSRIKAIAANYERMAKAFKRKENLRDSPYFFNHFHMARFKEGFPAIFDCFTGTSNNQAAVDMEIRDIEANYSNIDQSLTNLGMI
jgi:hypothetical protein